MAAGRGEPATFRKQASNRVVGRLDYGRIGAPTSRWGVSHLAELWLSGVHFLRRRWMAAGRGGLDTFRNCDSSVSVGLSESESSIQRTLYRSPSRVSQYHE